jgi:hypothetical protein
MRTQLRSLFISVLVMLSISAWAEIHPVKHFERNAFSTEDSLHLLNEFGKNKILIPQFALQTLIALSYFPELKNTSIKFIYKPAVSTLTTKPDFPSLILNGDKRTFTIIISDSSTGKVKPVILSKMDFNAQIGIIGHELSHVADFEQRSLLSLIGSGIGHIFSSRYIDRFEFRTDSICIAHGLGYQLLAWSTFIRNTMHTKNWQGADNINKMPMIRERYMNPSTIEKYMSEIAVYKNV